MGVPGAAPHLRKRVQQGRPGAHSPALTELPRISLPGAAELLLVPSPSLLVKQGVPSGHAEQMANFCGQPGPR